MDTIRASLLDDLSKIRKTKPLILNLTNYVAMDLTANALLAVGASPVMTHANEEVQELVKVSNAIVINIGTLDAQFSLRAKTALSIATALDKPTVLDPVGAGATSYRTETAKELLALGKIDLIRANASESLALFGDGDCTKGVDSSTSSDSASHWIRLNHPPLQATLVITGETDFILSERESYAVQHGHKMMERVTAMGCTASAICAAFLAVNSNAHRAALHAMTVMGVCGELAMRTARGPGTFRSHFLDALFSLESANFENLQIKRL